MTASLCPLDGGETQQFADGVVRCVTCGELLYTDELVTRATRATWDRYLSGSTTDTARDDAPPRPALRLRDLLTAGVYTVRLS